VRPQDNNFERGDGDFPIADIVVQLLDASNPSAPLATYKTDENGKFTFDSACKDFYTYIVKVSRPATSAGGPKAIA
jgi:hypothetical protein